VITLDGFFMIRNLLIQHPYKFAILWALIIFGLCSTPGRFIPTTSWLELLSFDKWVHASIFFILVILFVLAITIHKQNPKLVYLAILSSIAYGGLLEIMQAKVFSERSGDWLDFIANSFGCLMALIFYKKVLKLILR
jgi:hypothetical protein